MIRTGMIRIEISEVQSDSRKRHLICALIGCRGQVGLHVAVHFTDELLD